MNISVRWTVVLRKKIIGVDWCKPYKKSIYKANISIRQKFHCNHYGKKDKQRKTIIKINILTKLIPNTSISLFNFSSRTLKRARANKKTRIPSGLIFVKGVRYDEICIPMGMSGYFL